MKELLAVIDMQNDFITGILGTEEARAIVPGVCEKIKGWQGDVILTRDTHSDNYLSTAEGKMLPVPHCVQGTEGWQIDRDVWDAYTEISGAGSGHLAAVVNKPTFGSVVLSNIAADMDYERIVLCGVCTDICVISNAMLLRSALPEAEIVVDAACCAGVSPESHKRALEAMTPCNIKIIND